MNVPGCETTPYDILLEAIFGVPIFLVRAQDTRFPMGELQHLTELITENWSATTSVDDFRRLDLPTLADLVRSLAEGLESHLMQAQTNPPLGRLDKRDMRNLADSIRYRVLGLWLKDTPLIQLKALTVSVIRPLLAADYVVPRPAYTHYSREPGDEDDWPDIVDRAKVWAAVMSDERYEGLREIYNYVSDRMELGLEKL